MMNERSITAINDTFKNESEKLARIKLATDMIEIHRSKKEH